MTGSIRSGCGMLSEGNLETPLGDQSKLYRLVEEASKGAFLQQLGKYARLLRLCFC